MPSARPPKSASTSAASRSQFSALRLAITTSAPCSANDRTMAAPNPRLPPVTSATLPLKSKYCFMPGTYSEALRVLRESAAMAATRSCVC